MADVTQKICDGCEAAGRKGEPAYQLGLQVHRREGDIPPVTVVLDVHPNMACIKKAFAKADIEAMLTQSLGNV